VAGWERRLRGLPESRRGHLRVLEAVHTFGMRFPLDLLWLDGRGEVLRVDRSVPPRRVVGCRAARSVIELRAWYAGSR
jgi:uncharacterized membrane protein (UPF0127 family)